MTVHIVARHIKLTKALKDFIQEKVEKTRHYFENIIWAQVILTVEKRAHRAEIVIHASQQTMRACAEASDLYSAVDLCVDKIDGQMRKYKERLKKHRTNNNISLKMMESCVPDADIRFSVFKEVPLRPIRRDEAVSEMERLGYNFWMFMNSDTRQVNVVFKRFDSSYGLLHPVKKEGIKAKR
ncbi:MAG: ribosome-associated translation inhibitor RaiA [bacterium]